MEFRVDTDLATIQPRAIQSNVGEVKEWLSTNLQRFQQMIVEEGEIQQAKTDLAQIRKIKKSISEQRISVKKQFLEPFTEWETEVKGLEALCESAEENIDKQLKGFEEQKKIEKRNKLMEYFESLASASNVEEFVSFGQIANPKWLNATYRIEDCMKEIKNAVADTLDDVRTIYNQNSEFETALLEEYKQSHDLRKTLAKDSYLHDLREREAVRRNQISPKPVDTEKPLSVISENEQKSKTGQTATSKKPLKKYAVLLSLEMTAQQMRDLSAYFKQNNIKVIQSKHKEI